MMNANKTGNDCTSQAFSALNRQINGLLKKCTDQERVVNSLIRENYELVKRLKVVEERLDLHVCLGDVCPHTGR